MAKPLIGLPADSKMFDDLPFHAVGDKYARAVALAAESIPVLLPALGGDFRDEREIVASLDGLVVTGSPSNVHPDRYGHAPTPEHEPHDPARDDTTLPLILEALDQGLPLLAICRGLQELNVALGGTLHPRIHELPGRDDHRRPDHGDPDVQYGARHAVKLTPRGRFAVLAGAEEIDVNSLHWQAIDTVAQRLSVEGVAADGTIEAVSVTDAKGFALGVQWHPEYKVMENAFSRALFRAFGDAARAHATRHRPRPETSRARAG